jgi:hypothetical protein
MRERSAYSGLLTEYCTLRLPLVGTSGAVPRSRKSRRIASLSYPLSANIVPGSLSRCSIKAS